MKRIFDRCITYRQAKSKVLHHGLYTLLPVVARERRRGDRPPTKKCNMGDIYLVNVGRQGIRCLLAVKNGVGVAT